MKTGRKDMKSRELKRILSSDEKIDLEQIKAKLLKQSQKFNQRYCFFSLALMGGLFIFVFTVGLFMPDLRPEDVSIESWSLTLISYIVLFSTFFLLGIWFFFRYFASNIGEESKHIRNERPYSSVLAKRLFFLGLSLMILGITLFMIILDEVKHNNSFIAYNSPIGFFVLSIIFTGSFLLMLAISYYEILRAQVKLQEPLRRNEKKREKMKRKKDSFFPSIII